MAAEVATPDLELVDAALPISSSAEGARVEGVEVSGWISVPRVSRNVTFTPRRSSSARKVCTRLREEPRTA